MSFAKEVKNEIINSDFYEYDEKKYILLGALSTTLRVKKGKIEFIVKNDILNNYLQELFLEIYKKNIYDCDFQFFCEIFRNIEDQQYMIPNIELNNTNLVKKFITGIYIGCGSISNPYTNYHLEMKTGSSKLSFFVINSLNKFNINAKINIRVENYYIYIKEAEQISDFLKLCSTTQALLKFEDLRVVKDVRNRINRKVNCELANLNKIIETGLKQQEDILLVKEKKGLESLSKKLYDVAIIRLEDEQLSFSEIGEMVEPKVSKSTVCKRLKKISDLADELRGV